jgi:uncharacterized lipoprotein
LSAVAPAGSDWCRALLIAGLCTALGGCFSAKNPNARCDDPSEYQESTGVAGLKVPEGLETPSQASGYAVPPAPAPQGQPPAGPAVPGAACLARPPAYFRQDPATAPAAAPATPPAAVPAS